MILLRRNVFFKGGDQSFRELVRKLLIGKVEISQPKVVRTFTFGRVFIEFPDEDEAGVWRLARFL